MRKTIITNEPGWIRQAVAKKTYTADSSTVSAGSNGRKVITSGSLAKIASGKVVVAAAGDTCIGYFVHDYDVTDGDYPVSILTAGVVDTTVTAATAGIPGITRM